MTGAEVVLISRERSHLALARDFLAARGLKRVGFESAAVSVAQHRRWQESFPKGCELIPAQELLDGLRASKDREELAAMVQAQKITDAAFGEILNYIRPGLTEQEVAARLVYELLRRGARKVSFDPIVAAGANGSMPHAVPGETEIQKGMFVTMDFGCVYDGYCSDMTRTVAVGQPTQEMERVYKTVLAAQKAGIAAARAGMPGRELDAAARKAHGIESLPGSLEEALRALEADQLILDTLGEHVAANYLTGKWREWDEYRTRVSSWEREKYIINY